MKLSSALVLLSSTVALAAPGAVRRQTSTDFLENGSFESRTTGWSFTGPASIVSTDNRDQYRFPAASGSYFALLSWSNSDNVGSSIATPVSGLSTTVPQTLSFDWSFLTSSGGRGPPPGQCTLSTSVSNGITVQSWTRPAVAGGTGSVQETFTTGTSGGVVTIAFQCTSTGSESVNSQLAIDNVKWGGALA